MTLPAPAHPSDRRRVPALDGLRGLAVVGVLVFHGGLLAGGFLGVSAFFTLSGFLICGLLLAEVDATGRVDLRRFWARRARRLLPAAFACVALVLVYAATAASADQVRSLRGDVLAALGYVANWRFVAAGRDYGRLFSDPSPVQHFWSLAIEEQFYVVFPLLICALVWVLRKRSRATDVRVAGVIDRRSLRVWAAVVFAVLVAASSVTTALVSPIHAYYGTDTRATELLIGALTACLVGTTTQGIHSTIIAPLCRLVAPAALATILVWWVTMHDQDTFVLRGGLTLHALLVAVVIAGLLSGDGPLTRVLSWPPIVDLGRISYGVYLYHWPIYLWLTPQRTSLHGVVLLALRLVVSIGLSAVSWQFLERPILAAPVLQARRLRVTVPAMAASLVVVSLALSNAAPVSAVSLVAPPAPPLPAPTTVTTVPSTEVPHVTEAPVPADPAADPAVPPGSDASAADSPVPAATASLPATDPAAPVADPLVHPAARRAVVPAGEQPRILVVGDSAALTLGDGLSRWATETGKAQVWDAGSLGCAIARGGIHRYVNYRPEANPAICDRWATVRAQQVAEIRPQLVVVMSGTWDVVDRKLAGTDTWTHLGNPDADAYFESELRTFLDVVGAGGATVVWLDHPAIRSGIKEGLDGTFPESDPARVDRLNEIAAKVAASRDDTAIVDVRGFLQRQPGGELDLVRRPDGIHWTRDAGREDASWLGPALLTLIDLPVAAIGS